ncbi:MAG TPA: phosphoribosylformylglycinamidine synthase subunit PurL [Verrucomicrobiae bacterium]|nr:phosphoribosylformylglycinamidine synthase subunit PurL [Verrucomicrobiae bacterium]
MTEPAITPELVAQHNLTPDEYQKILDLLGREPSYTELGIFSVMWSEHCSYKNTRPLLKTFPTRSKKILVGAGEENAGIVDIGDGLAIAFKIESHNHPSAVEPFQGAATGVGGIVRDIFTMGARPICSVNSLRFGPITDNRPPHPQQSVLPHQPSPGLRPPSPAPAGEGETIGRNGQAHTISPTTSVTGLPLPGGEGRGEGESNFAAGADSEIANRKSQIANNKRLFAGVVAGIAHYGNCFGIPTIAGEVYFDKSYEGNPLVNAFCLGVLRHEQIARGAAKGIGNPVFYVGPPTGRDGLAGASFASQDLTEESAEQQRGAVQVGDPFMEKLVCEACLELLATGAVAGIQDMGAAGLTCSTCETAARAGTGIEIELDKVPQRAPNMTSYDLMLSESQERMLIIVHKGREADVKRIFDKWDLPWSEIGCVTDTGRMVVKHHGQVVADIPARKIADESPVYQRDAKEPEYLKETRAFRLSQIPGTPDPGRDLRTLLNWPTIASKNWVYRQYDHMVRDGSAVCPGSDAAVLRIKSDSLPELGRAELPLGRDAQFTPNAFGAGRVPTVSEKLIALTVDGNGAYVYLDPYEGGKIVVTEAARNLACTGATPLGVTDNLNYGNPMKPELFWQLKESVRGLADACRAFNTPVTGGNCSLYNQSPAGPIDPTPTVAMVGLVEKPEHITTQWFKDEGDAIILLGEPVDVKDPLLGLGGSAWLQSVQGRKTGTPPRCDLETAKTLHTTLLGLIQSGLVKSAHDCSEGGLAVCLAESCISQLVARETPRLIGATVDLSTVAAPRQSADNQDQSAALSRDAATIRLDSLLFGETQSRVVITCPPLDAVKVIERAKLMGVPAVQIGKVGGDKLTIKTSGGEFGALVTELHDVWWNAIARVMA